MDDIFRPGDTVYSTFAHQTSGGAGTAATSLVPAAFRNGVLDTLGTPIFDHLGTGLYRSTYYLTTSFVQGDQIAVTAQATYAGTAGPPVTVWEGRMVGWSTDARFAVAMGPFKISTRTGPDGKVECFVGDAVNLTVQMTDSAGREIDCDGAIMDALVTDSAGATSVIPTVAEAWDDAGWFSLSFLAPIIAGSYHLTLRRDGGTGDVSTAGPLIVKVLAR
jgi:hypothetical protein